MSSTKQASLDLKIKANKYYYFKYSGYYLLLKYYFYN